MKALVLELELPLAAATVHDHRSAQASRKLGRVTSSRVHIERRWDRLSQQQQ